MQASIIQISVIFLVQCFSVILQALCLFPFPLKHLTFANARTFRTVFDQKIGEKTEKDYVAAAKEIVKNVFLTVTTGCFSYRAVNQVRKLNE